MSDSVYLDSYIEHVFPNARRNIRAAHVEGLLDMDPVNDIDDNKETATHETEDLDADLYERDFSLYLAGRVASWTLSELSDSNSDITVTTHTTSTAASSHDGVSSSASVQPHEPLAEDHATTESTSEDSDTKSYTVANIQTGAGPECPVQPCKALVEGTSAGDVTVTAEDDAPTENPSGRRASEVLTRLTEFIQQRAEGIWFLADKSTSREALSIPNAWPIRGGWLQDLAQHPYWFEWYWRQEQAIVFLIKQRRRHITAQIEGCTLELFAELVNLNRGLAEREKVEANLPLSELVRDIFSNMLRQVVVDSESVERGFSSQTKPSSSLAYSLLDCLEFSSTHDVGFENDGLRCAVDGMQAMERRCFPERFEEMEAELMVSPQSISSEFSSCPVSPTIAPCEDPVSPVISIRLLPSPPASRVDSNGSQKTEKEAYAHVPAAFSIKQQPELEHEGFFEGPYAEPCSKPYPFKCCSQPAPGELPQQLCYATTDDRLAHLRHPIVMMARRRASTPHPRDASKDSPEPEASCEDTEHIQSPETQPSIMPSGDAQSSNQGPSQDPSTPITSVMGSSLITPTEARTPTHTAADPEAAANPPDMRPTAAGLAQRLGNELQSSLGGVVQQARFASPGQLPEETGESSTSRVTGWLDGSPPAEPEQGSTPDDDSVTEESTDSDEEMPDAPDPEANEAAGPTSEAVYNKKAGKQPRKEDDEEEEEDWRRRDSAYYSRKGSVANPKG